MKLFALRYLWIGCLGTLVSVVAGCKSPEISQAETAALQQAVEATSVHEPLILREGDSVRVTFPGAPQLNTVQTVRRDGKIALPMIGEVSAVGLTPTDLEKRLLDLYGPQLQTKEVSVNLDSGFQVYVVGAVLRPGKVVVERQLTAFEAIIEAGGFDMTRANMKTVRIIRLENGHPQYYTVNLKAFMQGKETTPFRLKPLDVVFVSERFTWF